jgi:uncharacterized cupredoxin-like copper-binding protein
VSILGLVASISVVAACGGDDGGDGNGGTPPAASAQTIDVSATEFAFDPSTVSVDAAGTVTIHLTNDGEAPHALEIEGNGIEEETDTIGPGESADLTVDLTAGDYVIYCPVDDHRGQGMEGTLTVGG